MTPEIAHINVGRLHCGMVWMQSDPSPHRLRTVFFLAPILISVERQSMPAMSSMSQDYETPHYLRSYFACFPWADIRDVEYARTAAEKEVHPLVLHMNPAPQNVYRPSGTFNLLYHVMAQVCSPCLL